MKKDLRKNSYLSEEAERDLNKMVDENWSNCLDAEKREKIEKQMSLG